MTKVVSLRSESDLNTGFSDVKKRLEKRLDSIQTSIDLERFIKSVNELTRDRKHGAKERGYLRRIRQRAYDRKRTLPESANLADDFSSAQPLSSPPLLAALVSLGAVVATSLLLWMQSVDLYRSSGFDHPQLVAAGALLMVLSFSAYYATVKSRLALLLCLYISGYEVQFMVTATFQDERIQDVAHIENADELLLLREKVSRDEEAYQAAKAQYEDPSAKVYKNHWYKQNHLDRAWAALEKSQKEWMAKKELLIQQTGNGAIVWLKICYRLGLVFLCMVLVHHLLSMRWSNRDEA